MFQVCSFLTTTPTDTFRSANFPNLNSVFLLANFICHSNQFSRIAGGIDELSLVGSRIHDTSEASLGTIKDEGYAFCLLLIRQTHSLPLL